MTPAITSMLAVYKCKTEQDYVNALKEIMQEIVLLGLSRAKFFDRAAFYGGTALRIIYKLDRFSEDLDFSLLKPRANFKLGPYLGAVEAELDAMGFNVSVEEKKKAGESPVESAFIKAGTKEHLIKIEVPAALSEQVQHNNATLKIKLEVDTDPPGNFMTEAKTLLLPIPFTVNTYQLPDLFAGKVHAILERDYKTRVKGRDFYDLVWYIARGTPLGLGHLRERLKQSGKWSGGNGWDTISQLSEAGLISLLRKKFAEVDFDLARKDVSPFIKDQSALSQWSTAFFTELLTKLKTC